jgi:hypothetical protein
VAFPVVLRNTGTGNFWDVQLRALHDDEETDRKVVRQVGPQSESDQIFLLIPAKFCDAGSPGVGLRPRGRTEAQALVGGEVVASVELPGGTEPLKVERVPRTPEEEAVLLQGRQPDWEYLFFAAVLLREMKALEPKYRDHEIGFATPQPGPVLTVENVMDVLGGAMNEAGALVGNVDRVFDPAAQERAFGAEGEAGDSERIEHLASRVIAIYEGLLDWAARVRGTPVDDDFREIADLVGHFSDLPIQQFRNFVTYTVTQLDRVPTLLAEESDEPVVLTLTLKLDMDEDLLRKHQVEMKRLSALYGVDE